MKRSEKQLPMRGSSSTFLQPNCSNFRLKVFVKGLRVIKIVKELNFEGVWGDLEAKKCFQKKPFTKYLIQTLVFMRNSFFANMNKVFILVGRQATIVL